MNTCSAIFQGTPYFNVFGGEVEFKLMSEIGYDCATMGNHDFDAGIEGFDKQLVHCDFPFVVSNYGLSNTPLKDKVLPYKVWTIDNVKIGLYGLGIELYGLAPQSLYGETQYHEPIKKAQYYEHLLKNELDCDYIICLSHLGFRYQDQKVSDVTLGAETRYTDIILGGHTHTFMNEPYVVTNKLGNPIFINQAGWAGIMMGRIDLNFEKGRKRKNVKSQNKVIN